MLEEEFDSLQAIGKLVCQQTVANENPRIVRIEVSLIDGDADAGLVRKLDLPPPVSVIHPTEEPAAQNFSSAFKPVCGNIQSVYSRPPILP